MAAERKSMLHESSMLGISFRFMTVPGGYDPLHYHDELEILYPLNGNMDLLINRRRYKLLKRNLTVIDAGEVHHIHTHDKYSMMLCIHISKKHLNSYFPNIELYRIWCNPSVLPEENSDHYLKLCMLLAEITKLYMSDLAAFDLEANGIILQVMAILLRYFSEPIAPQLPDSTIDQMERLHTVITYIQEHFREPIALEDISELLGIDKSYFCRLFKQNMGMTFLHYVNEVRLAHIYQDLLETSLPVAEIMERNGFANQKLFHKAFKGLYGCTPSEVRKKENYNETSITRRSTKGDDLGSLIDL